MNRKKFIRNTLIATGSVVTLSGGGILYLDHHLSGRNGAERNLSFATLDEALHDLDLLQKASEVKLNGEWSLYQNLIHCAQSIEFSMIGFPESKSALFQNTVGAWVFDKFESQGYMRHNRNEVIPKAPVIPDKGNLEEAFDRIRKSIREFESFKGKLSPHFAYGQLSKQEYTKAHAMHLADHLSGLKYLSS
jgi:Protein of unknown function (DUF1569)